MNNFQGISPYKNRAMRLAILIFALLAGFNLKAQDKEIIPLELEVEYTGAAFKSAYFSFTAPQDGKFVTTGNIFNVIYTDNTFQTEAKVTNSFVGSHKETQMLVTAGTTYYIAIEFPLDAWWFKASMNDGKSINLVSVTPQPNTEFPLSNGGFLSLTFDSPVSIGTALLQTGTTTAEISGMVYEKYISFELKNTLFSWLKNGVMKEGDTFSLIINDVKSDNDPSILYNGDGKLVLSWTSSAKPAEVTKSALPNTFKSYWTTTDPDGVATIEYDSEISTELPPKATISFGDAEVEGDYYAEDIPVAISGKTISLDFRGKRRIPANMVASGTNYGTMRLKVDNIRTADGDYVYSEGQGTIGSFQHSFTYELVAMDLTTEFTPASGTSLNGVNSVELWLSNGSAVEFDGVNVSFKDANGVKQSVDFTKEQCNYTDAGADGATLNIPITAEMQVGSNVTITLTNLIAIDGISRDITAVYNPAEALVPVYIDPENNSTLDHSLHQITLHFGEKSIYVTDGAQATITNARDGSLVGEYPIEALIEAPTSDQDGTTESVSTSAGFGISPSISKWGTYNVTIPAGSIYSTDGCEIQETKLTYIVKPTGSYFFTPNKGPVESLSTIFVEYIIGFTVSWNYDATLTNLAGEVVAKVFQNGGVEELWPEDATAPLTKVKLTLQDPITKEPVTITTPGYYCLTLPAGFFTLGSGLDTGDSPEVKAEYSIRSAGIDNIINDNKQTYEVYNLQGISIMSTTDKTMLNTLDNGLYIINGKKVYINK